MPATVEPADVSAAAAAVESAAAWLAIWNGRTDPAADATARRAASSAIAAIDDALAELHKTRAALITATRAADDATDARVDELLARPAEREEPSP